MLPLILLLSVGQQPDVPQSVRDYAIDFVCEQIEYYNRLGYNIIDGKIMAMNRINTGTAALTRDIKMWLLEYRLQPYDTDKVVLAEGMKMEDGWITEWSSTGQPLLVVDRNWDSESEICRRVGVTNTLKVQKEYQDNYTAAAITTSLQEQALSGSMCLLEALFLPPCRSASIWPSAMHMYLWTEESFGLKTKRKNQITLSVEKNILPGRRANHLVSIGRSLF